MSGAVKATINYQASDQSSNQQNAAQNATLSKLGSNPLNSGSLLEPVKVTAGSNSISHKLGTSLRGYLIVGQDAASNFYQESSDTKILKLNSSATCTVIIFVF